MNSREKAKELSALLRAELLPRIGSEYVLYGLPYYTNIGDTLIWEGTRALLRDSGKRCIGVCGWDDYPLRPLPDGCTILILGGGYFGDLWRHAWENVLAELDLHPDHRVILLPQSVRYDDREVLRADAARLSRIRDLVICARDRRSYDLCRAHFPGEILLLPDMAFAISESYLSQFCVPARQEALYLRRADAEYAGGDAWVPSAAFRCDWPTMERRTFRDKVFSRAAALLRGHGVVYDLLYACAYRRYLTRRGTELISAFRTVYTTRLHGMILAALLGKETFFIDNSYGKIGAFYDTWLAGTANIHPIDHERKA